MAVNKAHPRLAALAALFSLILISLAVWSCNTGSQDDVYSVTFKLDSARVGKFDSVLVQIYNGKAPGPGDTNQAVQTEVIKVTPTMKEITVALSSKVNKDFSVIITGFSGKDIAYRNLHTVDGFTAPDSTKPAVLLITRIDAEDLALSVGETRAPALTFTPKDAGDKRFILASRDSTIAKVVADSLKGLKAGKVKVIASTPDYGVSIDFTVNVVNVRVTGLQADSLFLKVGDSLQPAVTVLPANATDKGYGLASTDSTVLSVIGTSVKALKAGNVRLILQSHDQGAVDSLPVEVRVAVTGLKGKDMTVEVGDVFAPVLEWTPAGATHQEYSLESKDTTNVAVRGDSLEAKNLGAVNITATSRDGKFTAAFQVTVQRKVFHVKGLQAANLRALAGDTLDPKLTWDPMNASDQGFVLASRDSAVVSVLDTKLIAKKLGTVEVRVVSVDGAIADSFQVSVESANFKADILPITSFKCSPCHDPGQTFNWQDSAQLVRKGTLAMDRITRPDTAVGKMPLKGAPNGTLTARELKVLFQWLSSVAIPVKSVTLSDMIGNLGDTVAPALVWDPPNASNQSFTLTTSDTVLAPVIGNAIVPQGTGTATVFVQTDEGAKKLQAKLTVTAPAFAKNVLPITAFKCAPCHVPGTTFNWQDSVQLLSDGSQAISRLKRDPDAAGKMPLKGAPNGDLTPFQLKVLLGWLQSKVIPLNGITVPNDSVRLGSQKAPAIVFDPANATNKAYFLTSLDTAKVGVDGGEFLGKALGSTQVEVRAVDGNISKLITVKVIPVPVDSIKVSDSAGAIGDAVVPKVIFFPANAAVQTYTLTLPSPSTKVRIDSGRKVICLDTGKATLLATSTDGAKTATFIFTVGPVLPKALSVPDTNGTGSDLVTPRLIWTPASTSNKAYTLTIPPADTGIAAVRSGSILCKGLGTVAVVTATSVVNPAITASFKFTVGPVPVASISVAASVIPWNANFTPVVTILPANATNKGYLIRVAPADAAKLTTVSATTLFAAHLSTVTVVVKAAGDTTKTANWPVTVVRTPFTGAVKNLIASRCIECHNPSVVSPPNWQDSSVVVAGTNPQTIMTRIQAATNFMPPAYATSPGPLSAPDIATLVHWLSEN